MAVNQNTAKQIADMAGVSTGITGKKIGKAVEKLTNLTANVFATDIMRTLNFEKNPFDVFVRRDVLYGKGVRYVSTGIIESVEGGQGKYTPDQMGSKPAPDYEDFSYTEIQSTFPLIYNEPEMNYYFKNYENLSEFMNQIRSVNNVSYENERLNSFLYLFGNKNVSLPQRIKDKLDGIISEKFKREEDWGTLPSMKAVFENMLKLGQAMGGSGIAASDKYNIGFTKTETTGAKLNKSNCSTDLVLIMSKYDLIDLDKEASTIYHQSFYNGENKFYAIISCDIPSGTAWLVDKQAVRIYPRLFRTLAEQWMDMSVSMTSHVWAFWGVYKYANGTKITWKLGAPAAAAISEIEEPAEPAANTKTKKAPAKKTEPVEPVEPVEEPAEPEAEAETEKAPA